MDPTQPVPTKSETETVDVVILGGGLAGLTLARQLLLETDATIRLLERREVTTTRQKVGESSVQVGGHYFARILDLEEHLWRRHFMKYNLRFYWPSPGSEGNPSENSRFEDFSQAYIRNFSNIPSYQLDRNVFEAELERLNDADPRFRMERGTRRLKVELDEDSAPDAGRPRPETPRPETPHRVRYELDGELRQVQARWVVDATGRNRVLAKARRLRKPSSVEHGAFFWWVDGLVDVDRLTDRPWSEIRKKPERRAQGHLPTWLATNHFCAEGLWFWVIPLQGKTSLGLVYDKNVVDFEPKDVSSVAKATDFVCKAFPCLARDLPQRRVLDQGGFTSFAHDCEHTVDARGWALTGEAGRFSDPLYSPGSDLIAIYNSLITAAVSKSLDGGPGEARRRDLEADCRLYEQLMRAVYQAYLPSYDTSYDGLGDMEVFTLKYSWELTVYFALYVFPFINELFTDRRFIAGFLRQFARLGPINHGLQRWLSDYYRWKKDHVEPLDEAVFHDFMGFGPLAQAEKTFYEVGLSVDEGKQVLAAQMDNLRQAARCIVAWTASVVVDDPRVLHSKEFIDGIDIDRLQFDPEALRARWATCEPRNAETEPYDWGFDITVLEPLRGALRAHEPETDESPEAALVESILETVP